MATDYVFVSVVLLQISYSYGQGCSSYTVSTTVPDCSGNIIVNRESTVQCIHTASAPLSIVWSNDTTPAYTEDVNDPSLSGPEPGYEDKVKGSYAPGVHTLTFINPTEDYNLTTWRCNVATLNCLFGLTDSLVINVTDFRPESVQVFANDEPILTRNQQGLMKKGRTIRSEAISYPDSEIIIYLSGKEKTSSTTCEDTVLDDGCKVSRCYATIKVDRASRKKTFSTKAIFKNVDVLPNPAIRELIIPKFGLWWWEILLIVLAVLFGVCLICGVGFYMYTNKSSNVS